MTMLAREKRTSTDIYLCRQGKLFMLECSWPSLCDFESEIKQMADELSSAKPWYKRIAKFLGESK